MDLEQKFGINLGEKETELCFLSYNTRGFGILKQNFCKQLVSKTIVGSKIPILCNQENFLLRSSSYKINQALPDSHVIINPAIKEVHDRGSPKGGMFIAVPENFKSNIEDVSPNCWRL